MPTIADLLIRIGADDAQARRSFTGVAQAAQRTFSEIGRTPINTSNLGDLSRRMEELKARAIELRSSLAGAVPDSPEAQEWSRELAQVTQHLQLTGEASDDLKAKLVRLNSTKMSGLESSFQRLNGTVEESSSVFQSRYGAIAGISDQVGNGFLAVAGAGAVAGGAAIKLAADYEQTEIAFTTLLGSGAKAKAFLADMRDFAAKTPFQFTDLTKAATKMLAFGFAAKDVRPMLTSVGDAVAALGGGSEMVERVTTALGQLKAKGKVSAEEMMQLTEAGIPAWDMLAKKIGVDVPTAMKMSEKGAIDSETAIAAILGGMNKRYGGMMDAQSKTTAGRFSNLVDQLTALGVRFGEAYLPMINKLIDGAIKFAEGLSKVNPSLLAWGVGISLVLGGAFKLLPLILQIRTAIDLMSAKKALDTIATKLNTAAIDENTVAKLKNAGAGTGSGIGGGLSALGGTIGMGSVGGGLAAAGLYAVLAAAIAALGYELYGIFKYNADAKKEEGRGKSLDAENLPKIAAFNKTAQEHAAEAAKLGWASMTKLQDQASAGNKKAITDIEKVYGGTNRYAEAGRAKSGMLTYDAQGKAGGVSTQAEVDRLARVAEVTLNAEEQRATLTNQIADYEDEIAGLKVKSSTVTDAEDQARIAAQVAVLEEQKANAAAVASKRMQWETVIANTAKEEDRKRLTSSMNVEVGNLEAVSRRKVAAIQRQAEAEMERLRKVKALEDRMDANRLQSAELQATYANRLVSNVDKLGSLRQRQSEATDQVERERLATQIRAAEEEQRADEESTRRKLGWMDLIARTQDEKLRAQYTSTMNIELANMDAVSKRRLFKIAEEGDAKIRQLERQRKKEEDLANLRDAREDRAMAAQNRSQDATLRTRQTGERIIADLVGGAFAEQVGAQHDLENAKAKSTQRLAEIDAKEKRDLQKKGLTDEEKATIQEKAAAEREAVQGELDATTFDVKARMAESSVKQWQDQMVQATSSLWLHNADFEKGVQEGLKRAGTMMKVGSPITGDPNALAGLLGGDMGLSGMGLVGNTLVTAAMPGLGKAGALEGAAGGGTLGTIRMVFENGGWLAEMDTTSRKAINLQVETDDRDSRAGVL